MTPQQLKGSLLFAAMQGKIVEQNENELVPDLSGIKNKKTEEIGFDIPSKWQTAHLETISESIASKQYQIAASEFKTEGSFPVVSQSKEYVIGYCDDKTKLYHHDKPVVVFGDHTTIVKYVDFDFVVGADGVKIFEPNTDIITAKFFSYVLDYYSTGLEKVGGYSRHYKFVKDKPFPIPPVEEQHRIVAKIEELLPYIDRYAEAYEKLEKFNAKFPEDMKKSILQYAIQGKLVEQRLEEGTAEELYQQIQEEKQKLIKEGKIKKEKPLAEITEDEIPFEIPESWKWCRIGDTCEGFEYGTAKKSKVTGKRAVLRMGNIQFGKVIYSNLVYSDDEDDIEKYKLKDGDLLFNRTNSKEWVGKTAIYKGEMPAIYAGYLVRFKPIDFDSKYLNYVMQTQYYWTFCQRERTDAIGQSNINAQKLKKFVFPLPPVEEQHRIVAKIEELLLYCDRLKE